MTKKPVMIKSVLAALFAALISTGAFIQIPMPSGVPIVIQDMMALLSGMLLGPLWGSVSVLIFLLLGIIGLPCSQERRGFMSLLADLPGDFCSGMQQPLLYAGLRCIFFLKRTAVFLIGFGSALVHCLEI